MQKLENLGIIGLLCRSIGNPRHGVDLRQGVGYPSRGETEVPKWHPLGMPQRRYYSQRAIWIVVLKVWFSYTDSIGTLIND